MSSGDSFTGRHVVVTGGATGIGAAIARAFADHGADVTVMGRNAERLRDFAATIGGGYESVDVADEAAVDAAFAAAVDDRGPVAVLVNNAGVAESAPFAKMQTAMWRRLFAVNVDGTMFCTRAALPAMIDAGFGRVINIASVAGLQGSAYISGYCAAKHAVVGLTRALAVEVARRGITVNALCPGYTDTDMLAQTLDNIVATTGRSRDEALGELMKTNPQGRPVAPGEVADAALWLAGSGAAAITAQAIPIAGGEVM